MVISACQSSKGHRCEPSASHTQLPAHCKCHHHHRGLRICMCMGLCVCLGERVDVSFHSCRNYCCFTAQSDSSCLSVFSSVFLTQTNTQSVSVSLCSSYSLTRPLSLPLSVLASEAVNIYMSWNLIDRSLSVPLTLTEISYIPLYLCNWFFFSAGVHYLYRLCLKAMLTFLISDSEQTLSCEENVSSP